MQGRFMRRRSTFDYSYGTIIITIVIIIVIKFIIFYFYKIIINIF